MLLEADLTAPLSESEPSGPNLEYDPDFTQLEVAARGVPERRTGDAVILAVSPDWTAVATSAIDLLGRTRDLRVAVLLTRAQTRTEGLGGLVIGLRLINRLVDGLWDSLHPQLDADDDQDFTTRLNALGPLTDHDMLLADVRAARFMDATGLGAITVQHALQALRGESTPGGGNPLANESQLRAVIGAGSDDAALGHPKQALDEIALLEKSLQAKLMSADSVDLAPLRRLLTPLAECVDGKGEASATAADSGAAMNEQLRPASAAPAAGRNASAGPGQLASREDAIRALESVALFLESAEPSNPAPLLIRRAQRLLRMSFVDILRDMAPEGLESIEKISGASFSEPDEVSE